MRKPNKLVFINCPFDDEYQSVFHSIIFTILYCKYEPKCALEISDGTRNRLDNILEMIGACRLGIHDISRIEINAQGLPRFNMPFEFGIFLAAKKFGSGFHKQKTALILEKQSNLYQEYFSDIAGTDPKAHDNDYKKAISHVRNWLLNNTPNYDLTFPKLGEEEICKRFEIFYFLAFPKTVDNLKHNRKNLTYKDYYNFARAAIEAQEFKDNEGESPKQLIDFITK